ncbi:MAG TPA: CocE/NonD family hydrolase [Gaiellales bacterium]|nr:CocE/NonD family hydrolase [Gaiellales bacterium]
MTTENSAVQLDTLEPAPVPAGAEQVMVTMRDGVRLATDVYLPADAAAPSWPVILVRLPYDKDGRYTFMPQLAPHVTGRGYAFVVQDVRGKFRSEGETLPFVHEVDDGYDTLEWISTQPWAGPIGMFGDSYYGFTQWAAVAGGHPALRAIVPRVTSADLGSWLDEGVEPLYGAQYLAECWTGRLMHEWPIDWSHRPLAEVFDPGFAAIGERSAGFDALLEGGGQRSPYPEGTHPFDRLSIPVLHCVGWFDNISPQHMLDYMRLVADPRVAHLQYLIADATDHENYQLGDAPIPAELDHDANEQALERMIPAYLGPALDFFDAVLAGRSDPATLPRVRWRLGAGGWRESTAWPPPGSRELELFPGGGGSLGTEAPGPSTAEWMHDPDDLVPSTVTDPFAFLHEFPDERPVEGRADVLAFTGTPLEHPLDLAGPVTARLRVASSGPSMQLHLKLVDVFPDGRALMLVRGQTTVQTPGSEIVDAAVYLSHTGYRMEPGHRLRVQVASSDFPLYVPHPGTDESPWSAVETSPNRQRLHCGGPQASSVTVTVL